MVFRIVISGAKGYTSAHAAQVGDSQNLLWTLLKHFVHNGWKKILVCLLFVSSQSAGVETAELLI